MRKDGKKQIINWLIQLKGIRLKDAQKTADKLIAWAHKAYPVISSNSVEVEQVQYYAHRLLDLSEHKEKIIKRMVKLAKSLPNHDLENLENIPEFAQTIAVRVLAKLRDYAGLVSLIKLTPLLKSI